MGSLLAPPQFAQSGGHFQRVGRASQFEAMRVLNERRRGDFLLTGTVLCREV